MKQIFKKISNVVLILLVLLVYSCQKDDIFDDTIDKENPSIQKISFDHFLNEANTLHLNFTTLSKKILIENTDSKINNNLSIQVDKNKVTKITRPNGLYTYTFNVTTNDTDPTFHFYKLVLITQNGKYDLKLLKFVPTGLANNQNQFEGTITQIQFTSNPLAQKGCDLAITLEPVWMACSNHGYYEAIPGVCAGGHWEMQVGHVTVCDGSTSGGTGETGANPWDPSTISDGGTATYNGSYPVDVNQQVDAYFVLQAKFYSFTTTLSSTQQQYLETHLEVRDQIKKYLSENLDTNEEFTSESKQFVSELINNLIVNAINYTVTNYPGINDGMPFEWWKDKNYISNNLKPFGQTPNAMELFYFALFPSQATLHIKNSLLAKNTAEELVLNGTYTGIHNGRGDAFRHAYWNAFDTAQFGAFVTKIFTDAHEWDSGNHPLESQMDFYNNQKGRQLGQNISAYSTPNYVKNEIFNAIANGELKYIFPLDVNNNIISTSVIKFTNQ